MSANSTLKRRGPCRSRVGRIRILSPLLLVVLETLSPGCAPINVQNSAVLSNSAVRTFPSPLISDADFINLVSDDRALREQAFKNVFTYYNCLVKATPATYQRQDPTVLSRSQIVAFSELPGEIYKSKLDKLAGIVTDQNKSAMQAVVDAEIRDLSRIRWNDIKKEVNSIVGGERSAEAKRYACPLPDTTIQPQGLQLTQEWRLLRPVFFPPFM